MKDWVKSTLTMEGLLYLLVFGVALAVRFLSLGQTPLGDTEAGLALQAMNMKSPLSPQPGYLVLTSALFFLFGQDNGLARFWPALAGSIFVFIPFLFRQRIGREAAVVLAFALALEPELVVVSRQADGRMLALFFVVLSLGFILLRQQVGAGIGIGLALLGGPSLWLGVLSLTLAWFISKKLQAPAQENYADRRMGVYEQPDSSTVMSWSKRKVAGWALGSFVLIGSLLLTQLQALGAAAGSLASFVEGFLNPQSGQPALLVLLAFGISNPLAFVLAFTESVHAKRYHDETSLFLAWWWIVALLLVLIYPAHLATDLVWPAVPMLGLSARAAVRIYHLRGEKAAFFAHTGLTLVLLISMWLSLVGVVSAWNENEQGMRLAAMLAAFFLLLAATFLVIWGWGLRAAGHGLRFGVTLILILYTLATTWRAAGLSTLPENEIWRIDAYPKGADLLLTSIKDFSMWKTGRPDVLDVTVSGLQNSSILWELRTFNTVHTTSGVSANLSPSILVTPRLNDLGGNAPYSGQVIAWSINPDWAVMSGHQWLKWLIFREAPQRKQEVQLWARTDLFPGGMSSR